MNQIKSISIVAVLMITSQILLSLFLGYWLYTQFEEKKELLSDDIERSLRYSEERVIDTMLATNVIDPFLSDSSSIKVIMIDSMNIDSSLSQIQMGLEIGSDRVPIKKYSGTTHDEIILDKKVVTMIDINDSSAYHDDQNLQSTR